ncbi:hypothetical protein [Poseidonibacter sp.]|uniref:hypothetical protein n=1 Tax=Poseidonibacter sp. TaxID=2321188 RepID=UPI003C724B33
MPSILKSSLIYEIGKNIEVKYINLILDFINSKDELIKENTTLLEHINTYYVTKRRYNKLLGENRSLQEQLQQEQIFNQRT